MEEIGLESSLVDELIAGRKTVEARINKGDYRNFQIGDKLSVRRDVWENGQLTTSLPDQAFVKILGILNFESYQEMLQHVGYQRIIPTARSAGEALDICNQFYPPEEVEGNGVLAFELLLLGVNKT